MGNPRIRLGHSHATQHGRFPARLMPHSLRGHLATLPPQSLGFGLAVFTVIAALNATDWIGMTRWMQLRGLR